MKNQIYLLLCTIAAVVFVACGTDSESAKVLKELSSSYENEGREVSLVGYLGVPRNILVMGEDIRLNLYNAAGQNDNNYIAALKVRFGQGPSSYYVPEKYRGSDVEIYDSNGGKHGYMTKVKVTGTVHYTNRDWEESLNREYSGLNNSFLRQKHEESQAEAKKAAEEREKATGDRNDYSFELKVSTITIPE